MIPNSRYFHCIILPQECGLDLLTSITKLAHPDPLGLEANPPLPQGEPREGCSPSYIMTATSSWERAPGFLIHIKYEMIKVCCFKALNLGISCYAAKDNYCPQPFQSIDSLTKSLAIIRHYWMVTPVGSKTKPRYVSHTKYKTRIPVISMAHESRFSF